jgi:hypothetical protein
MDNIEHAYIRFIKARFPATNEQEVSDLEKRIGVNFPEDYREYLLQFNGGYFNEPIITPVVEGCPQDRLTFMYGIRATRKSAELGQKADLAIFDDNDPPQIVPIGYTLMGGLILLVTYPDPEEFGCVVLKKAWGDSFGLATSIDEFFGLLREPNM